MVKHIQNNSSAFVDLGRGMEKRVILKIFILFH